MHECTSLYNALNNLFKNKNVEIYYSIVTNGYELTKEFFDFCIKLNVMNIQITMDCGKYYHNKYRKSISGEDTYDRIIANVNRILDYKLPLTIRTNINNENICHIDLLFELLIKTCSGRKIDWSIAPIMNTTDRPPAPCVRIVVVGLRVMYSK